MKIISFVNALGGTGKTESARLVAALLSRYARVLLVDLDLASPYSPRRKTHTLQGVMAGMVSLSRAVRKNAWGGADHLPCGGEIVEAIQFDDFLCRLQELCAEASQRYDFLLFDTPPQMATATFSAFCLSDICVLPTHPTKSGYAGLVATIFCLDSAKTTHGIEHQACWFLLRMDSGRTKVSMDGVFERIRELTTKKGQSMAFSQFLSAGIRYEVVLFPDLYAEVRGNLLYSEYVRISGGLQYHPNPGKLLIIAESVKVAIP